VTADSTMSGRGMAARDAGAARVGALATSYGSLLLVVAGSLVLSATEGVVAGDAGLQSPIVRGCTHACLRAGALLVLCGANLRGLLPGKSKLSPETQAHLARVLMLCLGYAP